MSKHELSKKDCAAIAAEAAERAGTMTRRVDYDWLIGALRERDYYNPAFKVSEIISYLMQNDRVGVLGSLCQSLAYELREHRESRAALSQAMRYIMPTLEQLEEDDERVVEEDA